MISRHDYHDFYVSELVLKYLIFIMTIFISCKIWFDKYYIKIFIQPFTSEIIGITI